MGRMLHRRPKARLGCATPEAPAISRRALLRIGGLTIFGSACLPSATRAGASRSEPVAPRFGESRACIFMLLQGGPSHLDLWDPKPDAPAEIRGPFSTIPTAISGVRFGALLTETAKRADRIAVVRSVTHRFNNHIAGTYVALTGSHDQPNQDREAHADDFPGPGAVLNYLQPSPQPVPRSVSLPTWLSIPGPSNRMPGQYGGFLGATRDPFLLAGEPHKPNFKPLSLALPDDVADTRAAARWSLLQQLDAATRAVEREVTLTRDHLAERAYEMLIDPRLRQAIALDQESDAVRDRYGRTKIGQSLLLARRLVEAGVQFVEYNAFNQEWDTHGGLEKRYQQIVPPLDRAYSALVDDLAERNLLDSTLVIHCGEFGRTPILNKDAGRDHWPDVYSVALAGGGVRAGLVYGASDKRGANVASQAVAPADLLATMWHLLGVDPRLELRDRLGRPRQLSPGRVLADLLV